MEKRIATTASTTAAKRLVPVMEKNSSTGKSQGKIRPRKSVRETGTG